MSYYESYYDTPYHLKSSFKSPYYYQGCLARIHGYQQKDNPYGNYQDRFFTQYSQEKCRQDWESGWLDQDNELYEKQPCNS
jgi:hypothetical protein